MFNVVLGLGCLGAGVRFLTTHPEVIYRLGPVGVTWYHLLFAAGAIFIVRGIWGWVND